jgi:transaldolase
MTQHLLEKLAATNPDCEIWWDSSPLVYAKWKEATLANAPTSKRDEWQEQLTRLFDPKAVAETGEMGFRGVTTNPPLSLQALQNDPEFWEKRILDVAARIDNPTVENVYWQVYLEVVRESAALVQPVWEHTGGKYGLLSGQVDPRLVRDFDRMLSQGLEIYAQSPNVMVKIPGSKEGYDVIEELTARGIPTNNTTSFTVSQYVHCMSAVSRGLERAKNAGVDLSRWRSVITHMSARLGNVGDLKTEADARGIAFTNEEITLGEMAVLKRAYHYGKEIGHPSKMLQCSMRVVDEGAGLPAGSLHISEIAGSDMVYTCPPSYIAQLMQAEDRIPEFDAKAIDRDAPAELIERLRQLPYFRKAYDFAGMQPAEFTSFGSFAATATEFAAATRKTIDFVAHTLERHGTAKAA